MNISQITTLLFDAHKNRETFPALAAAHYWIGDIGLRTAHGISVTIEQPTDDPITFMMDEAGKNKTVIWVDGRDYVHKTSKLHERFIELFNTKMDPLTVLTTP